MKKIASLFTMGLLVGGLTFADDAVKPGITFGAWGRSIVSVYNDDSATYTNGIVTKSSANGVSTKSGTSWGNANRVGFSVIGTSQYIGFDGDIHLDNGVPNAGDNAYIWVAPVTGVKIEVGNVFDDTLRGNACFGMWDWLRTGQSGEDAIFSRMGINGNTGYVVSYTNGGLFLFVNGHNLGSGSYHNANIGQTLQYGAGYTFDGVGTIRAQVIGDSSTSPAEKYLLPSNDSTVKNYADARKDTSTFKLVEAAFKLTGVKDLYADIGCAIPSNSDAAGYSFIGKGYANYKIAAATVHGLAIVQNYTGDKDLVSSSYYVQGVGLEMGLGLDYDLGGGLTLNSDFRHSNKYQATGGFNVPGLGHNITSGLVGISKSLGNGDVGVGLQVSNTTFSDGSSANDNQAAHFEIPVRLTYSF